LTYLANRHQEINIFYDAIDAYPLEYEIVEQLNYPSLLTGSFEDSNFLRIHSFISANGNSTGQTSQLMNPMISYTLMPLLQTPSRNYGMRLLLINYTG